MSFRFVGNLKMAGGFKVWLLYFFAATVLTIGLTLPAHAGPLDNWTSRTSGAAGYLCGIAYGNNTYVAVGYNAVLTSTDGAAWTSQTSGTPAYLRGAAYENGTFVAVGEMGTVLTSSDGTTWTDHTSGTTNNLWGKPTITGSAHITPQVIRAIPTKLK